LVPPRIAGTCYALCIGINQYQNSIQLPDLIYAESDAIALYDLLGELDVAKENRLLLLGKEASINAINDALDFIIDTPNRNDLVIFYFAGHSVPITIEEETGRKSEVILASYDFDRQKTKNSRAFRQRYALGMERLRKDFFEGEGSRQRLFIFDSCYSGDFYGSGYRDGNNIHDPVQNYIKHTLSSSNVGRVALSSCLPTQIALEDPELGHGRFTYYLLGALKGDADDAVRRDGWLTVASLFDYLADKLPDDQRPVLSGVQHDQFKLIYYPSKIVGQQGGSHSSNKEEGNTWDDVLKRSQERSHRFLREIRGTPERPGTFIPELYVHREEAESALNAFLSSDTPALILVGDSGIGKTNLLCWWTSILLGEGHAVFLYNCGTFNTPDVEHEMVQDLSLQSSDELSLALSRISRQAASHRREFVLIFDATNEFRGDSDAGPEALVKHINALVGRLPNQNVRVVLSCRTSTWKRLESLDTIRLFSSRYFRPTGNDLLLHLQSFSPQILERAYKHYQTFFHLRTNLSKLSATLRERLRTPLILRLLAETYQDRDEPVTETLTLALFQRFYESRVRRRKDQVFIDELAEEMLRQRRSTFTIHDLAHNEWLRPDILSNSPDSSYYHLLDGGVLTELSSDPFLGDVVKFTYDRLGGYILARFLLRRSAMNVSPISELIRDVQELIHDVQRFPLAWDTARTLLVLRKDAALFASLSQSTNIELRELVVESLMELYTDEPVAAIEIIKQLLQMNSQEVRQTGLKAAYYINPRAQGIFLWAATKGTSELRQSTRDILYLIWRTDPDFTYGLLHELTARLRLSAPRDLRNAIEFINDLLVTIYINHCEQEYVIQQTSDIMYELAKNKLHLDWLNIRLLGQGIEQFIFQRVASSFSKPILDTLLLTELTPMKRFFALSLEDRACLKRIALFLDPQTDLAIVKDELVMLLNSDIAFFNNVAACALAIHAYHDFATTEALLRNLFEELGSHSRLWLLLSFAVLLPTAPPAWIKLVEEFTHRIIEEHPAIFYRDEPSILKWCDIALLPLGLAYGKRGLSMPYFEALIRDGLNRGNQRLVERCIEGMGIVGFYYPDAVFQTLRTAIPNLSTAGLETALVHSLSIMRVLYFDDVDIFLRQIGADETLQRRVSAATNVDLVSRYIYWIGFYNHCVHSSLFYPKMRRWFSIGALDILAEARTPEEFIARYTTKTINLAYEADFQLRRWTLPD